MIKSNTDQNWIRKHELNGQFSGNKLIFSIFLNEIKLLLNKLKLYSYPDNIFLLNVFTLMKNLLSLI